MGKANNGHDYFESSELLTAYQGNRESDSDSFNLNKMKNTAIQVALRFETRDFSRTANLRARTAAMRFQPNGERHTYL